MILDEFTLYMVAGAVIFVTAVIFTVEVASGGRSPVDRSWTLAISAALLTGASYGAATQFDGLWWLNAVGNGASVLTTFAMWNGTRAYGGRRPLGGVTAAAVVITVLAHLVHGPDGGPWAGGAFVLVGTAVGAGLAGGSAVRGASRSSPAGATTIHDSLRNSRAGLILTGVLLAVAVYYTVRSAIYLVAGPTADIFVTVLGTANTTLVTACFVNAAAFCMVALRNRHVRAAQAERRNFDPMTGARTVTSFLHRCGQVLAEARSAGRPVVLLVVEVEGVDQIAVAFNAELAKDAVSLVGEVTQELAPPGAMVGRESSQSPRFHILLPGYALREAITWAERLRREVIDVALPVPRGSLRLPVSIGVTNDAESGYELAAMVSDATARTEQALAAGGNRVVDGAETEQTLR